MPIIKLIPSGEHLGTTNAASALALPHICRHWHEQTLSQLQPCSESWHPPCRSPAHRCRYNRVIIPLNTLYTSHFAKNSMRLHPQTLWELGITSNGKEFRDTPAAEKVKNCSLHMLSPIPSLKKKNQYWQTVMHSASFSDD